MKIEIIDAGNGETLARWEGENPGFAEGQTLEMEDSAYNSSLNGETWRIDELSWTLDLDTVSRLTVFVRLLA